MEHLYQAIDKSEVLLDELMARLKEEGRNEDYEILRQYKFDSTTLVNNQQMALRGVKKELSFYYGEHHLMVQSNFIAANVIGRRARAKVLWRLRQERRGGQKRGRDGQYTQKIAKSRIRDWLAIDRNLSQKKSSSMLVAESNSEAYRDVYGKPISRSTAERYYRQVKLEGGVKPL